MKKLSFLLGLLLFCCGCSVDYRVVLTESNIDETLTIASNEKEEKAFLKQYDFYTPAYYDMQGSSEENVKIEGISYYDITHPNDSLTYHYRFHYGDYKRSAVVKTCYKNFEAYQNGSNIIISTSKEFHCFKLYDGLSQVNVSVTIPEGYEVISSNASIVNNRNLTWNILKSREDNHIALNIQKKIVSSEVSSSEEQSQKKDESKTVVYVLIGLGLFVIVLAILILQSRRK